MWPGIHKIPGCDLESVFKDRVYRICGVPSPTEVKNNAQMVRSISVFFPHFLCRAHFFLSKIFFLFYVLKVVTNMFFLDQIQFPQCSHIIKTLYTMGSTFASLRSYIFHIYFW